MPDEPFEEILRPIRGRSPGGPEAEADSRDQTPADLIRQAVAELDAHGRELSVERRITFCEDGGLGRMLKRHGVELGDSYYMEAFGGTALPDGADAEARPVWHQIQPTGSPPLGMLFLYYSPDRAAGAFAELWLSDTPSR